jgi:hypothetical protein
MQEHMERFASRGGGWDSHRVDEIFALLQVQKVMPQTYYAVGRTGMERPTIAKPSQRALLAEWSRFGRGSMHCPIRPTAS